LVLLKVWAGNITKCTSLSHISFSSSELHFKS
jgi:hypothetical protein